MSRVYYHSFCVLTIILCCYLSPLIISSQKDGPKGKLKKVGGVNRDHVPMLRENQITFFNDTQITEAVYYKRKFRIEMTTNDVAFLMKELSLVKSAYFEFGMGAQTSMSCEFAQKYNFSLYAVHSSSDTVNELASKPCLSKMIDNGQAKLLKIDIGKTGKYGIPLNLNNRENFHFYSDAIYNIRKHVDLILVDGRFRIASVLKSLIKFPNSRILLHDYYEPYRYRIYAPVRNYAYVLESSDTLVRLHRKDEITDDMIRQKLPTYSKNVQ